MGLAKALARLRDDPCSPDTDCSPRLASGRARDHEWIPVVASPNLRAIGRDKKVRTRPAEKQAIIDNGLQYIWIGGKA